MQYIGFGPFLKNENSPLQVKLIVVFLHELAGSDASAGNPRNRVGQISHSVVLGTFNVGDQGEGMVPDLSRVSVFALRVLL